MHLSQPDIFTFFRMGLATGLVDREAVIVWADRKVLESEIPDPRIMELSLAAGQPYSQLIGLLNHLLQGYVEYDLGMKLLFAHAGRLLEKEPDHAREIARGLTLLLAEMFLPQELKNELSSIKGDLELLQLSQLSYQPLKFHLESFLGYFKEYQALIDQLGLD